MTDTHKGDDAALIDLKPRVHELKTWPEHFQAVKAGRKRFEIRRNDRNYALGDFLRLREYEPATRAYSGDELTVEVLHVLSGGAFNLGTDSVAMSISSPTDDASLVKGEEQQFFRHPLVPTLREAIADGFSNGNEQYDDASEPQQRRYDTAVYSALEALTKAGALAARGEGQGEAVAWRPDREAVARDIAEKAIGVTWETLHADRTAARKAQRSGTDIADYGVHQDEILDAVDAILALAPAPSQGGE